MFLDSVADDCNVVLGCQDRNAATRYSASIGSRPTEIARAVLVIGTQKVAEEVTAAEVLETGERVDVAEMHSTADSEKDLEPKSIQHRVRRLGYIQRVFAG
jgi:hypothetical protein